MEENPALEQVKKDMRMNLKNKEEFETARKMILKKKEVRMNMTI